MLDPLVVLWCTLTHRMASSNLSISSTEPSHHYFQKEIEISMVATSFSNLASYFPCLEFIGAIQNFEIKSLSFGNVLMHHQD